MIKTLLICMLALPLLSCHVLAQDTAGSSPMELRIPFAQLRALLPADGISFVVWRGTPNRWPKNKGEFFKSEIGEIAFGRAVRAKEDDRKDERSLSPGIAAEEGYIQVNAGWRAHKEVPKHPDFFDGTISGRVFVSMEKGEAKVGMQNVHFHWNPSLIAKVVDFVGTLRKKMETEIAKEIRTKLEEAIKKEIQTRLSSLPNFDDIKSRISLKIVKDAVLVSIAP